MPRRGVSINYRRRTALYRLFDDEGRLLYVGITFNPSDRWRGHAASKGWWGDVQRREVEWHETRYAAEAAEVAAILSERPRCNIAGADEPPAPAPVKRKRVRVAGCDAACEELTAAGVQWRQSKAELQEADGELRALVRQGRREGIPTPRLAELSGMTREWVARIAPDPKAQRDVAAAKNVAES